MSTGSVSLNYARVELLRVQLSYHPDDRSFTVPACRWRRFQAVEALVARGQPIPILLPDLTRLENLANSAKAWRERTSRTFKRNSLTLLEVGTADGTAVGSYVPDLAGLSAKNTCGSGSSYDEILCVNLACPAVC